MSSLGDVGDVVEIDDVEYTVIDVTEDVKEDGSTVTVTNLEGLM